MLKHSFLTALILGLTLLAPSVPCSQETAETSENTKARPVKQEISEQMVQIGTMSARQQDSKVDQILARQAESQTPRSDFMFCTGLAYLGNAKAQMCVGKAYENALGVVEDLLDAHTWYAVACQTGFADESQAQKTEQIRDQVKERLISAYPHPTEEELEDQVSAQKTKIEQYQAEIHKTK